MAKENRTYARGGGLKLAIITKETSSCLQARKRHVAGHSHGGEWRISASSQRARREGYYDPAVAGVSVEARRSIL